MIQINAIRIDGGTQARVVLDQAVVAEYAEIYRDSPTTLPPVKVLFDGAQFWLVDGFHRYFAAKQAGLAEISEDREPGTQRDAVLMSLRANTAHGLRRTNADKRKAIQTMLDDPEWSQWPDREIARACDVSNHLVAATRGNSPKITKNVKSAAPDDAASVSAPAQKHDAPPEKSAAPDRVAELEAELTEIKDAMADLGDEAHDLRRIADGDAARQLELVRAELKAVKATRDQLMRENAQLKREVKALQRKQGIAQ